MAGALHLRLRPVIGLCALALLAAGAAAARPGTAAPTLTADSVTVSAKWKEGWLQRGRHIVVRGAVGIPATLQAAVRPVARPGTVTATGRTSVARAGPYSIKVNLPARPLPGVYRVSVSGAGLPRAEREFILEAPAEGIVSSAIVSATPNSRNVAILRGDRHNVYVRFRFLSPPRSRTVSIVWRTPQYKYVCQTASGPVRGCILHKPYARTVRTFLRSRVTPLLKGTWFCILSVGNTVARRAAVRLR